MPHRFREVDVFFHQPLSGNPLAVVHDADDLDTGEMQRIARWIDLSETTFLLRPTSGNADYRVRIFTPAQELPFAGHPTLGSAHAWLAAGGRPAHSGRCVQECGAGLVTVRGDDEQLAFAAPPLVRSGPLAPGELEAVCDILRLSVDQIVDHAWIDNGPGWMGVLLADADDVARVEPGPTGGRDVKIGVVGPHPPGISAAIEVRAFFAVGDTLREDPVTGSLNASVAQWLLGSGALRAPYVATQGSAVGAAGRIHVDADGENVWIGGRVRTVVDGTIETGLS